MNIGEIVKDSIKYPLSDLKKLLILGIIVSFSSTSGITIISILLGEINVAFISLLVIIELIIGLLVKGYLFRIIKSSLDGVAELPQFNTWIDMFKDGIKVLIVSIVYLIPAILIILIFAALSPSILGIIGSHPSIIEGNILSTIVRILTNLGAGIWSFIAILYLIIIIPISYIAIANMAYNDSKLAAAFKFIEILNKISNIGWSKLIVWYIMLGLIYLAINYIGRIILVISSLLTIYIVGLVLISLILAPYFYIYLNRSVALLYKSEENL